MKKALIISVALNLIIILGIGAKRYYYSHSPQPSNSSYADTINRQKNCVLQCLPINKGDIVFVGNSITERFPMNEMFGSIRIKNRGIGSNQTIHVLQRIGQIARAQPEKIFIEAGINDLACNITEQQIMINFRGIVDTIRTCSPNTQIYIQSVLPTTGPDQSLMPAIISLNSALGAFCKVVGVTLIDTYSPFDAGQRMDQRLTTDGTHLNYTGYLKYKAILDLYIDGNS